MPTSNLLVIVTARMVYMIQVVVEMIPRFEVKDHFAVKHLVSCMVVQPYLEDSLLVSYVHSGSQLREVQMSLVKEGSRMQRDVPHSFNFKFKAEQMSPLEEETFLVVDQAQIGYVFKASTKPQRFNRFYQNQKEVKVLGVISMLKRTLVLEILDDGKTCAVKELQKI